MFFKVGVGKDWGKKPSLVEILHIECMFFDVGKIRIRMCLNPFI